MANVQELWEEYVKKNDNKSFNLFYHAVYSKFISFATGIYKDRFQAEDAVSEAFIKLLKNKNKVRNNVVGFLYTVIRNGAVDYWNKIYKELDRLEKDIHIIKDKLYVDSSFKLNPNEMEQFLNHLKEILKPRELMVWYHYNFLNKKLVEIAAGGIPLATVKKDHSNAWKKIKNSDFLRRFLRE